MPAGSWIWLVTGRASGASVGPFTHIAFSGVMGRRRVILAKADGTPSFDPVIEPADIFQADRMTIYALGDRQYETIKVNRRTTYLRAERY